MHMQADFVFYYIPSIFFTSSQQTKSVFHFLRPLSSEKKESAVLIRFVDNH